MHTTPAPTTSPDTTQLNLCISLAHCALAGHLDLMGRPLIDHALRVMDAVRDPHDKMVAVLHDVVPTTWVGLPLLDALRLPASVMIALHALTPDPSTPTSSALTRVLRNPLATRIKRAELLDQLEPTRLTQWYRRNPHAACQHELAWFQDLQQLNLALDHPLTTARPSLSPVSRRDGA